MEDPAEPKLEADVEIGTWRMIDRHRSITIEEGRLTLRRRKGATSSSRRRSARCALTRPVVV
jgi:hypothetical protein